ncbi:MAG: hypothetical protein R3F43_28660 [bacterium]
MGCAGSTPTADDDLFCNGAETCDVASGDCRPGGAPACDDGVDCTADRCDEGQNRCVHDAQDVVCDDGNLCTDDRCDLRLGCQQVNNAAPCDDGEICTEGDRCRDGACAGGPPPSCDDGRACTADRCVIGQGCVRTTPARATTSAARRGLPAAAGRGRLPGRPRRLRRHDGHVRPCRAARQSFGLSETLIVDGDTPPEEERQDPVAVHRSHRLGAGAHPAERLHRVGDADAVHHRSQRRRRRAAPAAGAVERWLHLG